MILVRDIFHLKFGKAREAKELIKKGKEITSDSGYKLGKTLMDLTGKSYTMVLETEFENLGEFEKTLQEVFSQKDWQKWYQQMVPLVDNASREIYTVVD